MLILGMVYYIALPTLLWHPQLKLASTPAKPSWDCIRRMIYWPVFCHIDKTKTVKKGYAAPHTIPGHFVKPEYARVAWHTTCVTIHNLSTNENHNHHVSFVSFIILQNHHHHHHHHHHQNPHPKVSSNPPP